MKYGPFFMIAIVLLLMACEGKTSSALNSSEDSQKKTCAELIVERSQAARSLEESFYIGMTLEREQTQLCAEKKGDVEREEEEKA